MAWASGSQIGPYLLLGPIGSGGMGEVWKARDTRLNRVVAIKRLSVRHGARFEQEARAIAALNHPHICQLYDVGPDYLVLEYIEGKPLHGPLSVEQAVRLALQIAAALEEAHSRGILHRDLKPGNILVTEKGTAKLLDFGLAKLRSDSDAGDITHTSEGTVMGTAAYMAPEQAEGKPLDERSEVFSFGAVLYEMLSASRAFAGTSMAQVISAVLRDDPPPIQGPRELQRIVARCLRKAPAERFQTVTEVRIALEQLAVKPAKEQPSIAVLPFANIGADKENEYFSDGLAEEIINLLAHIPGLKVIARTSAFAFKGKQEDIRGIAQVLGVATILEGSVRRLGNRLRVTAQLIAATDGSHLWSERFDREMADVFAIQDEIAEAIASALQVKLAGTEGGRHPYTPSLPAYEALLKARHHLFQMRPGSSALARECLMQAATLDPGYAQPHAQLGLAYLLMGTNGIRPFRDVVPQVRAEARAALAMDPSEPAPNFLLGAVAAAYDYDWSAAAHHFQVAMAGIPGADTRWAYTSYYLAPFGRFQESISQMQQAVEQDPLNVLWRGILASILNSRGMHDAAREEARKAIEIDENHGLPYSVMSEVYLATGRLADAVSMAERAHQATPWHSHPIGLLAGALVRAGDKVRAAELIRQMGESPLPGWGRVLYHLLSSEIDAAADWYEKMIEQREPFAIIFARAPVCKELRESPRWPRLARMMNLPERVERE